MNTKKHELLKAFRVYSCSFAADFAFCANLIKDEAGGFRLFCVNAKLAEELMKIIFTILIMVVLTTGGFAQAKNPPVSVDGKPFVLGVVREMQSAELAEKRILNIYLPE